MSLTRLILHQQTNDYLNYIRTMNTTARLPKVLNGREIFSKVVPTVNTLKNLFKSLESNGWDYKSLKNWEKPIFKAYNLEQIISKLRIAEENDRSTLIKQHLLKQDSRILGAHPICIYLLAYFFQENESNDFKVFEKFVQDNGISNKKLSAQAIWSVGTNDGKFLNLFDDKLNVIDWDFFNSWINNQSIEKIKTQPIGEKKEKVTLSSIKEKSHKIYFLNSPNESKVFKGPNSLSWSLFVYGNGIAAQDLLDRNFYRDDLLAFCSDKSNSDLLTLLAILSWGGMNREHGKNLFTNTEPILDIVNKLRNSYFKTRVEAFNYIQEKRNAKLLPGLGIGYFTKLICFLAPELNGYIMDQWVAKSINLIAERNIVQINKSHWVTDENNGSAYETFCDEVDKIGALLNLSGYKAEEKFFSIGGRNKGAWRKYVIENYKI